MSTPGRKKRGQDDGPQAQARRPSPARPKQPQKSRAAPPRERKGKRNPEKAARALDVKLRAARARGEIDVKRLLKELNSDEHFRAAYGAPLSEAKIHEGLQALGQYSSASKKRRARRRKR